MHEPSRREFIALTAAVGTAGAVAAVAPAGFGLLQTAAGNAAPARMLNIGIIGCGGRGSGAANDTLMANPNVRIVAMADIDVAKAKATRDALSEEHDKKIEGKLVAPARIAVGDDRIFGGLDGYQKVIDLKDVDLVILATAPGFRPIHIAAAEDDAELTDIREDDVATTALGLILETRHIGFEPALRCARFNGETLAVLCFRCGAARRGEDGETNGCEDGGENASSHKIFRR